MKKEEFMKIVRSKAKAELNEQEVAMFESIGDGIERALQMEQTERNAEMAKLTAMLGAMEEGKPVAEVIRTLAQKIDAVEAQSKRNLSAGEKFQLKRALEAKKDEIMQVIRGEKATPWGLEFRAKRAASALMQTTTVLTGAAAINTDNVFDDLEITVIKYPVNFIGDAINSRQVSVVPASIKWKEQITAGTGAAGVIAEGAEKTLVDYKFSWKYAYRKKYAGRIEFTEETEIDFEQLTLDIIDMFEVDVLRAYNAGLLADIVAWAPAYVSSALDGTLVKPTILNVVNAGKLAVAVNNYNADTLIINPEDYAGVQNMQNADGDPIFVPDSALFPGLRVFVTNNITQGTVLVGEGGLVKEQHGAFILRSGTYGNQFIENEKTIVGELYSVIKLPTESKKGWCKLDVDTVLAALEVAQP